MEHSLPICFCALECCLGTYARTAAQASIPDGRRSFEAAKSSRSLFIQRPTMQAFDNSSEGHSASRSRYLLDLMAKNKAATAVATVAGAAAGGAVAGPFGIAAGMTAWYLPASYATMLAGKIIFEDQCQCCLLDSCTGHNPTVHIPRRVFHILLLQEC